MANFVLMINEPTSHEAREQVSNKFILAIALALFLFIALLSNWYYGLIVVVVFGTIQIIKSSRWDKYFITRIRFENEQVEILYKEANKVNNLTDNIREFKFKKEIAFNRTRTAYLAIYYKNNLLIKQFEIGEWSEEVFDNVIAAFLDD